MLPPLPSIEPKENLALDALYERRINSVAPPSLVWASEAPMSLSAEPMPPRRTLELVPPADPWDVWRTPTETETETETGSGPGSERAGAPQFAEVLIDEEMLAVGAQSSSLRRIPAGTLLSLSLSVSVSLSLSLSLPAGTLHVALCGPPSHFRP